MSTAPLAIYNPRGTQITAAGPEDVIATFVQGAVLAKTVWAVSGPQGLAHVASPTGSGQQALLVWSAHHEASKWADVLSAEPELVTIDIPAFMSDTLARVSLTNSVVATDWSSEPIEPELQPAYLLSLLQQALVRDFVMIAGKTRSVFVLQSLERVMPITVVDGRSEVVPVWCDRAMAEAAAQQLDAIAMPVRMPLAEFTGRFLLSAQGVRARIAPGYVHCPGAVSYATWEFKALLNGGGMPSAIRVA